MHTNFGAPIPTLSSGLYFISDLKQTYDIFIKFIKITAWYAGSLQSNY